MFGVHACRNMHKYISIIFIDKCVNGHLLDMCLHLYLHMCNMVYACVFLCATSTCSNNIEYIHIQMHRIRWRKIYIYIIHTNAHVYVNGSVPMRMWKKKHASRVIRLLMQMRGQKYSRSILRIYWYGVAIPLPTPLFGYIHVRTLVVCCFKTILYLDASS
jgi:hypothetical protein